MNHRRFDILHFTPHSPASVFAFFVDLSCALPRVLRVSAYFSSPWNNIHIATTHMWNNQSRFPPACRIWSKFGRADFVSPPSSAPPPLDSNAIPIFLTLLYSLSSFVSTAMSLGSIEASVWENTLVPCQCPSTRGNRSSCADAAWLLPILPASFDYAQG